MSADVMQKIKTFFTGEAPEEDYEESEVPEATKRGRNIAVLPPAQSTETLVLEPRSFDEGLQIIGQLRERRAVVLNLHYLPQEQQQRLVDFVAGATTALDGHQERISDSIFMFSPANHKISTLRQNEPWGIVTSGHRDLAYKVR